jgi:hypothetical protein
MSKRNMVLTPLFACSSLLVVGALNHQPFAAPASFVAQPVPVDPDLVNLTGAQLLGRAAGYIAPDKVSWLTVKTWQKLEDAQLCFEAHGRLVRGPDRCARLEMTVHLDRAPATSVIVSDGVGMAEAIRLPGHPAVITSRQFLTPDKNPMTVEQIDHVLNAMGCGGPYCLLKDMERVLENLKVVHGAWKGKPVIRLTGTIVDNAVVSSPERITVPPRRCHVLLDARTLWPFRVEWWASRSSEEQAVLLLQLEFRDPVINRPMSHADCAREFTFQPEEVSANAEQVRGRICSSGRFR